MNVNTGNLVKNCENWASIDGYVNYEVSWWGRVRNTNTGRILKAGGGIDRYLKVGLCREGTRKTHFVHQLVAREWIGNADGKRCVDHIDNDRSNNHHENLRYATCAENSRNMKKHTDGSSVYKGVSYCNISKKWRARIYIAGKDKNLGFYTSEREAGEAYNAAAVGYYKEFAKLNIFED